MHEPKSQVKGPAEHEYRTNNDGIVYATTLHKNASIDVCPQCQLQNHRCDITIKSKYDPSFDKTTVNTIICSTHGTIDLDLKNIKNFEP